MSGLVRKNDLFSKAFIFPPCFRAPWNCRSIETQACNSCLAAWIPRMRSWPQRRGAGCQEKALLYIYIYIYRERERENYFSLSLSLYIYRERERDIPGLAALPQAITGNDITMQSLSIRCRDVITIRRHSLLYNVYIYIYIYTHTYVIIYIYIYI